MKAVVKTGPGEGQLELKDWPEPSPAPDEVKIKIAAAGICGTAFRDCNALVTGGPLRAPSW
jgi:threonine dehydrogenase-like Zn-dependent dehydrogenase